nr:MAG TPA: Heat shock factor binding protein 1 [Caudoviricetes sp.]
MDPAHFCILSKIDEMASRVCYWSIFENNYQCYWSVLR